MKTVLSFALLFSLTFSLSAQNMLNLYVGLSGGHTATGTSQGESPHVGVGINVAIGLERALSTRRSIAVAYRFEQIDYSVLIFSDYRLAKSHGVDLHYSFNMRAKWSGGFYLESGPVLSLTRERAHWIYDDFRETAKGNNTIYYVGIGGDFSSGWRWKNMALGYGIQVRYDIPTEASNRIFYDIGRISAPESKELSPKPLFNVQLHVHISLQI
ncbi:MAG: hypothetical protein ACRBF0_19210 [Calditrichia bacterium]